MTEIERKALALLNEFSDYEVPDLDEARYSTAIQALCRAIEQHEAFKQEVSEAVKARFIEFPNQYGCLDRFIIAKPDPLVEALKTVLSPQDVEAACNALAARGFKIVEDKP